MNGIDVLKKGFLQKSMRWMPVVIWMGSIFYVSSIPYLQTEWGFWDLMLRKIAHMGEYALLFILLLRAWQGSFLTKERSSLLACLLLTVLYAAGDEFHQKFVPGRCCSFVDIFIDTIGAVTGLVVWKIIHREGGIPRAVALMLCGTVLLCGCGADYHFQLAKLYESRVRYAQANHHYQQVIDRYPKRAAEAMFLMGENFRRDNAHDAARRIYFKVSEKYPDTPWAALGEQSIMNTPDYFPLLNGYTWVEGDSETGGQNMRLFLKSTSLKEKTRISRKYFAGKQEVKELSAVLYYEKKNFELREYKSDKDTSSAVLIKYPVHAGLRWQTTRDGEQWYFHVNDTDANVKVRAGRFEGCLKISEENLKLRGSVKYNYYAPGVGRVLTTTKIAGAEGESRNTELLSFKKN